MSVRPINIADKIIRQQLAEIVLQDQPCRFYEGEKNKGGNWCSLSEGVASGVAFFGPVRPEIVAIDIDQENGLEIAKEMEKSLSYPTVIVASGQPGRAHVFLRVEHADRRRKVIGSLKRQFKDKTSKIDVRQSIRPPLTPHRMGKHVKIINCTPEEAINRLKRKPRKTADDREREITDALMNGWAEGERNKGLFWLACECIRARWTESQYIQAVLDHPEGAGEKVYEERATDAQRVQLLQTTFRKAQKEAWAEARKPLEEWLAPIKESGQYANGRSAVGPVAEAIAIIATKAGTIEVALSERRVADQAGVTRRTAGKAIRKLCQDGHLQRISRSTLPREANQYRLIFNKSRHLIDARSLSSLREVATNLEKKSEAFRGRFALMGLIELLMGRDGATVKELAELKQAKSVQGLYPLLNQLIAWGLVQKQGKRYSMVSKDQDWLYARFDEIAELRGTVGVRERIKERHQNERTVWLGKHEPVDLELSYRKRSNRLERVQPQRLAQSQTLTMTKAFVPMLA